MRKAFSSLLSLVAGAAVLVTGARARADEGVESEEASDYGRYERSDGVRQDQAAAYASWFGHRRTPLHPEQLAIDIGILIAAGFLYYWADPLANKADWDNPSLDDRINLRALRFDTNLNTTNHLLHPVAGGLVYGVSRINGLGVLPSFALAAGQSLWWELVLEWREKSSINDLFFTSVGGIPLGELVNHATGYFTSAPRGGETAHRVTAWSLGFMRRVHQAIQDEPPPAVELPPDNLGFSSAYAHRFGVRYELARLSNDLGRDGLLHRVGLDASLIAMPGFLHRGCFTASFSSGNFTELSARLGFSPAGTNDEADLEARTTLAGVYDQRIGRDAARASDGHAFVVGLGSGLRFQKSRFLGRDDQLSTVHLLGPQAELWLMTGRLAVNGRVEAYGDFGAIESLASATLRGSERDGTKFVLQRRGYAYSLGAFGRARTTVSWGPVALRGSAAFGRYETIEGLDRFQEGVTHDLHGVEHVIEVAASAAVTIVDTAVVEVGARRRRRESRLGGSEVERWDGDVHAGVGLVF